MVTEPKREKRRNVHERAEDAETDGHANDDVWRRHGVNTGDKVAAEPAGNSEAFLQTIDTSDCLILQPRTVTSL